MAEQTLEISFETIGKVILTGIILYVLFLARSIVIWFFFALIISLLVEPAIAFLRWIKIPKLLAAVLVYVGILGFLGVMIWATAPIFIFELSNLGQNIPSYFEKISPLLSNLGITLGNNFEEFTVSLVTGLQESSDSILKAAATFFGGVSSTMFIFTLAFFISIEERGPERVLSLLTPKKYEEQIIAMFERAQYKVASWFGARILACMFVGVASFVVFLLLGVKYAFILSLISAVLNFVPYIGPTITLILAMTFVGVSSTWMNALYVLIAILAIQEIENKFITPMLMKKFMDLPPFLVLIALLIGGTVFGFMGTLFAVPVFGIIYEFLKDLLEKRRGEALY